MKRCIRTQVLFSLIASLVFCNCSLFDNDLADFFETHSNPPSESDLQKVNAYYVSDRGYDTNTGGVGSPFNTLQKALDCVSTAETENNNYIIYITGSTTASSIDLSDAKHKNITIQSASSAPCNVELLTVSGEGTHITLGENVAAAEIRIQSNASLIMDKGHVTTLSIISADAVISAKQRITQPIHLNVTNLTDETLLIKNEGANFTLKDFTLEATSGSLYLNNGNLFYTDK